MEAWRTATLFVALVASCVCGTVEEWPSCNGVIKSPGITIPKGDITLLQGDDLTITCLLNPHNSMNANASHLHFFRNMDLVVANETHSLRPINETALQLRVFNAQPSDSVYYCHIVNGTNAKIGVCSNKVVVGTYPQNVSNFSCISNNWDNLTCTWKPDALNYVKTNYSLQIKYDGRAGRNLPSNCPRLEFEEGVYRCMWDLTTDPPYRQSLEYFKFNLTGINLFGTNTQLMNFNHYANVKPAPPTDLAVVDVSSHGATVTWSVHHNMMNFQTGLVHRVIYCSEMEERCEWKEEYESPPTSNNTMRHRMKLDYPNTRYDVRVFIKTEKARDDNMWSNFNSTWFKTLSAIPAKPPDMNIGGFESLVDLDTRKVFVYWRQIEKYEENGENFTYQIVDAHIGHEEILLKPVQITKSYMVFDKLPYNETEIHIKSFNSEGSSERESHITIPAVNRVFPGPRSFTKIEFENGLYELSWKEVTHPELNSYTIFWCDNSEDKYRCESRIQWETISPNITTKNITVKDNKPYQFAISANSLNSSSGMVWAQCTIDVHKSVSKISNLWVNTVGDMHIDIGWKIDCLDRVGAIKGYNILYCPIYSLYNKSCKEEMQNITLTEDLENLSAFRLTNLKPHTTYKIQVATISKYAIGIMSDPLYNNTNEGAPSAPTNVTIHDVSYNRMMVSWLPPVTFNGFLRKYILRLQRTDVYDVSDYHEHMINPDVLLDKSNNELIEKFVSNLSDFTNYTVTVVACTVSCSKPSEPIVVRTAIGKPGIVKDLSVQQYNSSLMLNWRPPDHQGGYIDLYEVNITKVYDDNTNFSDIFNTTASEYNVPVSLCSENGISTINFYVRAVNIDHYPDHGTLIITGSEVLQSSKRPKRDLNSVMYKGNWSGDNNNNVCIPSNTSYAYLIYIFVGIMMVPLIYGLRHLWICFKNMQNIKPRLPPGLSSTEKEPGEKNLLRLTFVDDRNIISDSSLNRGLNIGDISNGMMSDNCNDSENTDSTCVPSLASTNNSNSDDARDMHAAHDGVHSETISANSSPRSRNTGSRPTSAASMHSLNQISPQLNMNLGNETSDTHYTTIGVSNDLVPTITPNVEVPKSKGYVTVGELQNINIFNNVPKPPVVALNSPYTTLQSANIRPLENNIPHITKTDLPMPPTFAINGINNISPSINNISTDKNPLVLVDNSPMTNTNYDYDDDDESIIIQLPNKTAEVSNKPVILDSGYVKRNDPDFLNEIEACFQKKLPSPPVHVVPAPKQNNLTNIIIPRENVIQTEPATSPEAYCRFGPNVNVPQPFDYHRSEEDLEDGLLSIRNPDGYEYEKHSLLEKTRNSDPSVPPSHYVPIQNITKP